MDPIRRVTVAALAAPFFLPDAPAGIMRMDKTSRVMEHESNHDFASTERRLLQAVDAAGMTLFARIDHAAAASAVGLTMPATVVLVFGNPKGGTPAMRAAPDAALELPLRVLLREDDRGRMFVCHQPIEERLVVLGVPGPIAQRLQSAQEAIVAGALS